MKEERTRREEAKKKEKLSLNMRRKRNQMKGVRISRSN